MKATEIDDRRRAELRRYVGAYFLLSGWQASLASVLQLTAVALAASPSFRSILEPLTKWIILALAGMAPLARSRADEAKSMADGILRCIEMSDALGTPIPALEAEQIKEDASSIVDHLARKQPEDLKPYASALNAGVARLVDNVRESAWWSARLARELARWEYFWASAFGITCIGALYHFSTSPLPVSMGSVAGARDAVEFAAALLVFVFAEGFYRRARELKTFAEQSQRAFERAARQHASSEEPSLVDALSLATDYYLARQASPRLSSRWYNWRRARLNAAWARAQAVEK